VLVSDFDFDLPAHLIAQTAAARGESRLLVLDRAARSWRESHVRRLPSLLAPGDLVVVNDTRVLPARLIGRRDPSGGAVECLLLDRVDDERWHALVHPGQKLKPGSRMVFEDAVRAPGVRIAAEVLERQFFGRRLIRLAAAGAADVDAAIDALGHVPLPPYIHRPDAPEDRERYQTVFARLRGSIAAPTAGLHFDDALLGALAAARIELTRITLHVGYGTFKPVRVDRVEDHTVDAERYEIPNAAAAAISAARSRGGRVVAVGTTTTRALESAATDDGLVQAGAGETTLFIHPGFRFRVVDALLTNFHLPRSSLLMLVSAFAGRPSTPARSGPSTVEGRPSMAAQGDLSNVEGRELVLDAYRAAIASGFRFYSYGDAMLLI
jgi:S-adenosylmethionine:tRNA ribosyltransferase-isomerase